MAHTLHVTRQRSWLWVPTLSWVQTIRHPPVVFGAAHDTVHLGESIISTAPFQQFKYQNWILTPSCVPLRSTKQRGHQKRVGWTSMWMCGIVGHSASLPPPSVLPKAPYTAGFFPPWICYVYSPPPNTLHYFWLPFVLVHMWKGEADESWAAC